MSRTYEIKLALALTDVTGNLDSVRSVLQATYDGGTVAGRFELEPVGSSIAVVTFLRDWDQDQAATGAELTQMTPDWAMAQLLAEIKEMWVIPEINSGHVIPQVCHALERKDATVTGLPVQMPRVRIFVDVAFPDVDGKLYFLENASAKGVHAALSEFVPSGQALSATLIFNDSSGLEVKRTLV